MLRSYVVMVNMDAAGWHLSSLRGKEVRVREGHYLIMRNVFMFVHTYFRFSVSVFVKDGVGADEDENADAHGEGPEHLHPLRVPVLRQEPR